MHAERKNEIGPIFADEGTKYTTNINWMLKCIININ